jgi:hypothetical protein
MFRLQQEIDTLQNIISEKESTVERVSQGQDQMTSTNSVVIVDQETQTDVTDNLFECSNDLTGFEDELTVYETPFLSFRTCDSSSNMCLNYPQSTSSYKVHTSISNQDDENSLDVSFDLNDELTFNSEALTTTIQPIQLSFDKRPGADVDRKTMFITKR